MNARMIPAAVAALALVTFVGSGQSEGIGRPLLLRPATVTNPLLGVRDGSLVRLKPGTLMPKGRGLLLGAYSGVWSFAPVRFAVVGSDGTLRSAALDQVRAGVTKTAAPQAYTQVDLAGLAVDPSAGRAYVVAANDPVAEVDLRTLAVGYHTPSRPV